MLLTRRQFLLSPLALAYKPSWSTQRFPLPAGHFIPARMPLHPVFPRPDSETQPHARHRWAHPDFPYEIPIGVQGGAWPFKYEIVSGPNGATIGQYYGDPDYGVVKWTPSAGDSGTKTFIVRVTDQELNTINLTWTTTIAAAPFIFVDTNTATTGSGTIQSPLKTFSDWYKGDRTDPTYHNKIIVFRGGTYQVTGHAGSNVNISQYTKTPSLIGMPGENVVFDCSKALFYLNAPSDIFIADIEFTNSRTDVANPRYFWVDGLLHRAVWWRNRFTDMRSGTSGTDNPGAIFVMGIDNGSAREYFYISDNVFNNIYPGSNVGIIDLYQVRLSVVERNTMTNGQPSGASISMKGTRDYCTVRANHLYNSGTLLFGYSGEVRGVPHHNEMCWNYSNNPDGAPVLWAMNCVYADPQYLGFTCGSGSFDPGTETPHHHSWAYRNTFVSENFAGDSLLFRFRGADPYHTDANVVVVRNPAYWNKSIMQTSVPNIIGKPTDGIIDPLGRLAGNYRAQYLGICGHELSTAFLAIPKSPTSLSIS